MPFRIARQAQSAVAHDEMLVARRDDDAAGGGGHRRSIRRIGHAAAGLPVQPVGKRGPERLVDVQDDQDRELEIRGQTAQDFNNGAGAAGRCADGDEVDFARSLCGSVRGHRQRACGKCAVPAGRAGG